MKLYIRGSNDLNPFNIKSTDTSFYDNFLDPDGLEYMQDEKNLTGEIVMMSPKEYFQKCSDSIFHGQENSSVEDLKRQRELSHELDGNSTIKKYEEDMLNGDKFPLCYLDYSDNGQEGLHRMYAAGEAFGWNTKFPVLVVRVYDQVRREQAQLIRQAGDFERYKFPRYVDDAISQFSDWNEPIPPDMNLFCNILKDYIETRAKTIGYDIEVDVEARNLDDIENARINCYLTSYNGYELPTVQGRGEWLGNMFKVD